MPGDSDQEAEENIKDPHGTGRKMGPRESRKGRRFLVQ